MARRLSSSISRRRSSTREIRVRSPSSIISRTPITSCERLRQRAPSPPTPSPVMVSSISPFPAASAIWLVRLKPTSSTPTATRQISTPGPPSAPLTSHSSPPVTPGMTTAPSFAPMVLWTVTSFVASPPSSLSPPKYSSDSSPPVSRPNESHLSPTASTRAPSPRCPRSQRSS